MIFALRMFALAGDPRSSVLCDEEQRSAGTNEIHAHSFISGADLLCIQGARTQAQWTDDAGCIVCPYNLRQSLPDRMHLSGFANVARRFRRYRFRTMMSTKAAVSSSGGIAKAYVDGPGCSKIGCVSSDIAGS